MTNQGWGLVEWLEGNRTAIAHRWRAEVRNRGARGGDGGEGILRTFLEALVSFLPPCLGSARDEAEEVWNQTTHLYGSFALQRGLAAGEVVEELGLLREVILKLLLEDSTVEWRGRNFQRDLLTLNRVVDAGIVGASIAFVDDLFFAHLQGSGVPEGVTPELEGEIVRQLAAFQRELQS